jgi:hypothetical protein
VDKLDRDAGGDGRFLPRRTGEIDQ